MTEIKFTNLMGVEVTVMTESRPAQIKCYLCSKGSENIGDFTYCGNQGFAHPDCLNNDRAKKEELL